MTEQEYNYKEALKASITDEQKQKYEGKSGIYSISYKGEIIYVGKSKDILNRILAHITNSQVLEAKEFNRQFYCELRRLAKDGKEPVQFDILEYCDEQELNEKEGYYIRKHYPKLNTVIPQEFGPSVRKSITPIRL